MSGIILGVAGSLTCVRTVVRGAALAADLLVGPAMRDQAPGTGETACLVRGLGGPLTSYVEAGRGTLEALGFRVVVHDMTASSSALESCGVIVAHSAGAVPALATTGRRQIFISDGFASALQHCPAEATCTNFYNPGDVLGGTLVGGTECQLLYRLRRTGCGAGAGSYDDASIARSTAHDFGTDRTACHRARGEYGRTVSKWCAA